MTLSQITIIDYIHTHLFMVQTYQVISRLYCPNQSNSGICSPQPNLFMKMLQNNYITFVWQSHKKTIPHSREMHIKTPILTASILMIHLELTFSSWWLMGIFMSRGIVISDVTTSFCYPHGWVTTLYSLFPPRVCVAPLYSMVPVIIGYFKARVLLTYAIRGLNWILQIRLDSLSQ